MNFVSPDLPIVKPIAIVGSSASLKWVLHGEAINNHKTIIRFNRAPVNGFSKYVGNRTDIRVVNTHVLMNIPTGKEFTNQPIDFIPKIKNCNILHIGLSIQSKLPKCWDKSNKLFNYNYKKKNEIYNKLGISLEKHPSVGFMMICLCLINNIVPDIYGFDLNCTNRTHYFEDRPNISPCHDLNKSQEIINNFFKRGLIKIF